LKIIQDLLMKRTRSSDTKRLITSFAIFDYVTFHRYCIGRATEIIKQDDREYQKNVNSFFPFIF